MCSEMLRFVAAVACVVAAATGVGAGTAGAACPGCAGITALTSRFRALTTRLWTRASLRSSSSNFCALLANTFRRARRTRAVPRRQLNTLDEVSVRAVSPTESVSAICRLRRSPGDRTSSSASTPRTGPWLAGKSPGGFISGLHGGSPGRPWPGVSAGIDPVAHPQLATGAEPIGTLFYYALGYHVEDVYAIRVDPARIKISDKANIRDASRLLPFAVVASIRFFGGLARDREGRVYRVSATRFHQGQPVGNFKYHDSRSDDPNDIHPHEHRRELRANRVFSAWLAHDDSRAVNTLDLLVAANGRKHIRHYMYDFGAILGSATVAERSTGNQEHYLVKDASLAALARFGFAVPRFLRVPRSMDRRRRPRSTALVRSGAWKANYATRRSSTCAQTTGSGGR